MLVDIVVNGNCVFCGDKLTGNNLFLCDRCMQRHKEAEWVDSDIPGSMLSKCTSCGFSLGAYTFNYCPNCGASMKKGSKDVRLKIEAVSYMREDAED